MTAIFQNVLYDSNLKNSYVAPSSPPPEKIIGKIHPQTIGLYESTKKLSFAPNINKDTDAIKNDSGFLNFLHNPISKRFLNYIIPGDDYKPQFVDESNNCNDNVVEVKAVVDGMINSLNKLNKIFQNHNTLPDETLSEHSFGDVVYFNSNHTLATFVDIKELHKTPDSILYMAKNRFDRCTYVLKSALIESPWNNCRTLNYPNLYKLREAQILSTTNHENIVRFYSVWFEQHSIFIQIEHMIGSTLHYMWYGTNKNYENTDFNRNLVLADLNNSDVKLTAKSAKKLIKHISAALKYLHNDLKLVHNHINSLHIYAAYSGMMMDYSDKILSQKKIQTIRSVMNGDSNKVVFKLFDFSRSYAVEENPIPRRSLKLNFLNEIKHDQFYKDIFAFGIVLCEAFLSREEFYNMDFLNDKICENRLSRDSELNAVIGKMTQSYDMKELTADTLVDLVHNW